MSRASGAIREGDYAEVYIEDPETGEARWTKGLLVQPLKERTEEDGRKAVVEWLVMVDGRAYTVRPSCIGEVVLGEEDSTLTEDEAEKLMLEHLHRQWKLREEEAKKKDEK